MGTRLVYSARSSFTICCRFSGSNTASSFTATSRSDGTCTDLYTTPLAPRPSCDRRTRLALMLAGMLERPEARVMPDSLISKPATLKAPDSVRW